MLHPLHPVVVLLTGLYSATLFAAAPSTILPNLTLASSAHWVQAPTPPMGWNSYNNFGSSVTEDEVMANATYMQENLLAHGWNYVVVDFRWADATAANYDPNGKGGPLEADSFGRLLPAPNRFPSAADGKGFKPLADKIHGMGLKFGIHLMRGIPKQSVKANAPIEGSTFTAADAVNDKSTCSWCKDMSGVLTNPAGQAWYDSFIRLYASWGVDFVKVDDLSKPYSTGEIEMIRVSMNHCGRPMVFSTSPGATPISKAKHVAEHANMWRLSEDFWDSWPQLRSSFSLADSWTIARGQGHWPDLDMLQLGRIGTRCVRGPRQTRFTPDEQLTHMTLWCIARSPLMFGGDLTQNDAWTKSLITNDEVLAVNQQSLNNRQLWRKPSGHVAWIADVPNSKDKYVGLFHIDSDHGGATDPSGDAANAKIAVTLKELNLGNPSKVRDLWNHQDLGTVNEDVTATIPLHGAALYRVSELSH